MLDIQLIRDNPEAVAAKLKQKGCDVSFDRLLLHDAGRREALRATEALKAKRNAASARVPQLKKEGKDTTALFDEMKALGEHVRAFDEEVAAHEAFIQSFLEALPNLPDDDVPPGGKENNEVLHTWGEPQSFAFEPKNHVELAESLDLIDYERGAKLSGSGFWVYTRDGARLEWALINYFIQQHLEDGYEFIMPPYILGAEAGYASGQFPKFAGDVFHIASDDGKDRFLLPTAETPLVNLHRDEVLNEEELPRKYFAYTQCFRSEAGSYRTEERGMIRGHQFNKVELVQYTTPAQSAAAFDELVGKVERIMRGLGLAFRLTKLAAEDCSASMARTYDVEVWIPSMGVYKEISSASNANEYQARRGNVRFKPAGGGKPQYVHTLNASGIATSRVFPAILEQYQQADGSVRVPEALRPWFGKDYITRR